MDKYLLMACVGFYLLFPEYFSSGMEGGAFIIGKSFYKDVGKKFLDVTGLEDASQARSRANKAGDIAQQEEDISNQLFRETTPLRLGGIDLLQSALTGEDNLLFNSAFNPQRELIEGQFGNLRESILSTIPGRGGQLNDQLLQARLSRIGALNTTSMNLREALINQAISTGFQTPQITLAGLHGAGQTQLGAGGLNLGAGNLNQNFLRMLLEAGENAGMAAGGMG